MTAELGRILVRQHEIAWRLTAHHLKDLGDGECLWRPSGRGPHVAIEQRRWRGEWPDHEGYDLGPPSIAWLLWHIDLWWSMVLDHSFGDASLAADAVASPGTADALVDRIASLHGRWTRELEGLDDDELLTSRRTRWPFRDRPFADVVAWVNTELTKNAAEIGYARFLFATRAPTA
jgi:hypothetical protein